MTRLRRFAASVGRVRALLALVFVVALPAAAAAQPYIGATGPHRGTLEMGGGVVWTGGYDAGSAIDASLTKPGGGSLPLFAVSARMLSAPGGAGHVGMFLGRRLSAEAALQYSRPILRARLTKDFELAPDTDADEMITSYLAIGSLLYHFGEGRVVPFVSVGGGYLRQLHEGNAELLTGTEVHAGGGVTYWLGIGAHRFGLRIEAAASARSKSVAFVEKRRILPSATAGMSYQL